MSCRKLVALGASISIAGLLSSVVHAKKIYPGEIMGRDLNYPGLGWLGHVGITNRDMYSSSGMQYPADLVIEVLNEPTVGQINSIGDFISRSKFWGSKWGVSDQGERGYQVLVEANHQRWWCPTYTSDTKYKIGQGIPSNGCPS